MSSKIFAYEKLVFIHVLSFGELIGNNFKAIWQIELRLFKKVLSIVLSVLKLIWKT